MKNLKKVLALVVVFAMMMSTVAFASYPDVDTTADYAGAVELLSALEILKGDDQGNFNPDNTITRAEFAAVVCRALGLESSANSAKGATMFVDVAADHWATGYINLASQQGIVNGKGNGIFDPEGNVTFAEAVKMLVVALGYEPVAAEKGGFPTGYLTVANSTKMTSGVSANGTNAAALRSTVAMLTANALEIPMMDQTYGSEIKYDVLDDYNNYTTLLTKRDIYVANGVVGAADEIEGTVEFTFTELSEDYEFGYTTKGEEKYDAKELANGDFTATFNIAESNIKDYYQQNVNAYVQKISKGKYDVLIAVASGVGTSFKIAAKDLYKANADIVKSADSYIEYYASEDATKTSKIYVAKGAKVYVNGVEATKFAGDLTPYMTKVATIEFVENTDDKYNDVVLITVAEDAIVDEVKATDPENTRITLANGKKIVLDLEDDNKVINVVDKNGKAIDVADFAEFDVLSIVVEDLVDATATAPVPVAAKDFGTSGSKITITNIGQNAITGTVDGESDDYIYIDGKAYEALSTFADGNEGDVFDKSGNAKLGTEGMFFLSAAGKIIGFDGTAGGNVNYGYILQTVYSKDGFDAGWQIKMLTADGINTYSLYSTFKYEGADVKAEELDGTSKTADKKFLTFDGKANFAKNPDTRIVEFKLTADGAIKSIDFVKDATAVDSTKSYNVDTNKVGGKTVSDNVVIFDIAVNDIEDAKVYDLSYLVDEGDYAGYVAAKDEEYDVFVMTAGSAKFTAESQIMVVESVRSTTINDNDAVIVSYLTAGASSAEEVTFVDGTSNIALGSKSATYTNLSKGDVFLANANAEGVVNDYVIIAEVDATKYTLALNANVVTYLEADEDAGFVFAEVKDYSTRGVITVDATKGYATKGLDLEFRVGSANEYLFNSKLAKPNVQALSWDTNYDEDKAGYMVFGKFCEDSLVDIYAVGYAK